MYAQKAIVERDGRRCLIMYETGEVVSARSVADADRKIRARASCNPGMTITEIEWRDGLTPPAKAEKEAE